MKSKGKQVSSNLIVNVLSFTINIVISIWLTPYLVTHLGRLAYGLVPMTLIFNQYISIITNSLTSSFTRFYSVSLQRGDTKDAQEYFNTSFFSILLISILALPFIFYGTLYLDRLISIPSSLKAQAVDLFRFTLYSFFVSVFTSLFNISLYAKNRLDLMNGLKIVRIFIRSLVIILCFTFSGPNLYYLGLGYVISEIVVLLASVWLFKLITPEISVKVIYFDKSKLLAVTAMSFWVICHQLGDLAIGSVDIFFVNKYIGVIAGGDLEAIAQWTSYVSSSVALIGTLFGPLLLTSYARGETERVISLCRFSMRFLSIVLALIIGMLCGFSKKLIEIWLGPDFVDLSVLFMLKLVPLLFSLSIGAVYSVFRAWNKIRKPALFTICMGFINVLFIVGLSYTGLLNQNVIVCICGCFLIIQSFGFGLFYFANLYKLSIFALLKDIVRSLILLGLAYFITLSLNNAIAIDSWYELIIIFGSIGSLLFLFSIKFLMKKLDKEVLSKFVPLKIFPHVRWLFI